MFIPTRAAGLEALDDFVARAGSAYTRERNHDHGPSRSNVSGLSPYLRHRLVTEREVVAAVLSRHSLTAAEKFVQEVFWRTYWKGWLEQNPEVWRRYRREVSEFEGHLPTGYHDALEGRSGIDAMDAWVRELVETGYLHNHTRMWFASIWVFTLGLPWQLGADFFYRHLLDGDAASNTLSWRWVAGLQTPGKTYLATASNIAKYTEGRFSPQGLATSAPALSEALPPRTPIEPDDVDGTIGTRPGLLLHEEDLDAGSLLAEQPGLAERLIATAVVADPGSARRSRSPRRCRTSPPRRSPTPRSTRRTRAGGRRGCWPMRSPRRSSTGRRPSGSTPWWSPTRRSAPCRSGWTRSAPPSLRRASRSSRCAAAGTAPRGRRPRAGSSPSRSGSRRWCAAWTNRPTRSGCSEPRRGGALTTR